MIKQYVQGNLLDAFDHKDFDLIVHGCNCFHLMGAGIAGSIHERYPLAYYADVKFSEKGDFGKLGSYTYVQLEQGIIINGYTQYRPGKCPTDQLYANIKDVFTMVNKFFAGKTVGIPKNRLRYCRW